MHFFVHMYIFLTLSCVDVRVTSGPDHHFHLAKHSERQVLSFCMWPAERDAAFAPESKLKCFFSNKIKTWVSLQYGKDKVIWYFQFVLHFKQHQVEVWVVELSYDDLQ